MVGVNHKSGKTSSRGKIQEEVAKAEDEGIEEVPTKIRRSGRVRRNEKEVVDVRTSVHRGEGVRGSVHICESVRGRDSDGRQSKQKRVNDTDEITNVGGDLRGTSGYKKAREENDKTHNAYEIWDDDGGAEINFGGDADTSLRNEAVSIKSS